MRVFLIAGEASGDNLGGLLIEQLQSQLGDPEFAFWGGDRMQEASGLAPKQHLRELAFMGFVEVIANLRTILGLITQAKADISSFNPDALICIDYPGFNLRIAKWAKAKGIKVFFYVSPQIWAWRQSRVHKIVAATDRILCILPFEKDFYERFGYDVAYVGHPLPKRIDDHCAPEPLVVQTTTGPEEVANDIIALLPGSRQQEIERLLPTMLQAASNIAGIRGESITPVLAAAPALSDEQLHQLAKNYQVAWHRNSYDVLAKAKIACVASGTATLETALFNVPQVVCYKGSRLSVVLARQLIKVKYIALVNLILNRPVVPELIQQELTSNSLTGALKCLLSGELRDQQLEAYTLLRSKLKPYDAAAAAAREIVSLLTR